LIYPITGGLSDIFGRRAFLVAGSVVMIIGYIVALLAKNIPILLAAMIIQGFGSGAQQLA
jgi:MFS family permease